ncbi:type II secretion system minor pseudopilin GspJ [Alteromonas sp. 1_MG-2023]|uniref:type II secretion system minor pseudopilin GspJ n=1 Tax=Alteromonas sp. 1_MG-2023 TaxID=3062669 RepID=UPI0026E43DA7|nr:type II secretion system minor pseudopilin GspJ [Alteromonas sp. 1_MG-2023]MDO6474246.1 type II secretion system minor pseudopilin GspJ [Alteromonas sp. 1_MG-2023]
MQRGFTLVEILIAIAIFAFIGVASTAVLTTVIDSDELSSARFEKFQRLQRAVTTIERDMQQAVPRAVRTDGQTNTIVMRGGESDESDNDGLAFVRSGWQNPQMMLPRSTLQAVAYRIRDGKLERLYTNYVDNVVGTEPKVRVLLEDISEFKIEFIADIDEEENSLSDNDELNWRESFVGATLPKAIAFEFVSDDFGRIRREFTLSGASL